MWSQNTAADGSGIVLLSEVKEEWMLVMLSSLSRGSVVSAGGKAGSSGVVWGGTLATRGDPGGVGVITLSRLGGARFLTSGCWRGSCGTGCIHKSWL